MKQIDDVDKLKDGIVSMEEPPATWHLSFMAKIFALIDSLAVEVPEAKSVGSETIECAITTLASFCSNGERDDLVCMARAELAQLQAENKTLNKSARRAANVGT